MILPCTDVSLPNSVTPFTIKGSARLARNVSPALLVSVLTPSMSFTGMPVSAGRVYFLGAGEAEIGPLPDSLFRDDALANLAAPSRPFTVAVVRSEERRVGKELW